MAVRSWSRDEKPSGRRKHRASRRPMLERLEERTLLASAPSLTGAPLDPYAGALLAPLDPTADPGGIPALRLVLSRPTPGVPEGRPTNPPPPAGRPRGPESIGSPVPGQPPPADPPKPPPEPEGAPSIQVPETPDPSTENPPGTELPPLADHEPPPPFDPPWGDNELPPADELARSPTPEKMPGCATDAVTSPTALTLAPAKLDLVTDTAAELMSSVTPLEQFSQAVLWEALRGEGLTAGGWGTSERSWGGTGGANGLCEPAAPSDPTGAERARPEISCSEPSGAVARPAADGLQHLDAFSIAALQQTWDVLGSLPEVVVTGPALGMTPAANAWGPATRAGALPPVAALARDAVDWLVTHARAGAPTATRADVGGAVEALPEAVAPHPLWESISALTDGENQNWLAFGGGAAAAVVQAGGPGGAGSSSGAMAEENRAPWALLFSPALFLFSTPRRYQATILLVEHDEPTRDAFHELLADEGYLVLAAGTARDAWGVIRTPLAPIDLVLLDAHLPDVSGLALYARLRELYPDLPVVVCTGGEFDATDLASFREMGAPHYLRKPIAQEKLLATVQAVLSC